MQRFFISPESIRDKNVTVRGTVVHQIRDVLRMRPGDEIIVLDNTGWAFRTELAAIERDTVRGRVTDKWKLETEPRAHITLYQGLLKGQKFDWVLQKGTELGITGFVPVLSSRCIIGSVDDVSEARLERWQRIIVAAAEQAGRAVLPTLSTALIFKHACESAKRRGGVALIPWENERNTGLREATAQALRPREFHLFIGPEGGFAEEEVNQARDMGIIPVSLGPRILRAETAGLAAAAAILSEQGDFG